MDNIQKAVEIIKSLLFVIEGYGEVRGLIDSPDVHYTSSTDMIDVDKLIKEAKLFIEGE